MGSKNQSQTTTFWDHQFKIFLREKFGSFPQTDGVKMRKKIKHWNQKNGIVRDSSTGFSLGNDWKSLKKYASI